MWVVFRVESLSGRFSFIVTVLLRDLVAKFLAEVYGIENELG